MGHSFQVRRKWNRDLRIQLINVIILGQEAGCCGIPKQWLVSWLQFMVAQGFGWRTSKILACLSFVGNFEQFFIFSLYFYRIILDYIWPQSWIRQRVYQLIQGCTVTQNCSRNSFFYFSKYWSMDCFLH